MTAGLDDLEPGPMPRPTLANLEFLDHLDHLDAIEESRAPGFWHAVPAFSPVMHEESPGPRRNAAGGQPAELFAIRTIGLSVAFFLLVLAGAAASAFVFADRLSRLVAR